MIYTEFKEWLENNSNSKHIFLTKWKNYQISKNSKRTGKTKKWDDDKPRRHRPAEAPSSKTTRPQ